jgi:hypothetical protein
MSTSKPVAWAAGGVAAVVLAFGAYTIGSNTSGTSSSGTAVAAQSGGEKHVAVSQDFKVTGVEEGPPGMGGAQRGPSGSTS